jgi:mono/diheme cytochrome c family protein
MKKLFLISGVAALLLAASCAHRHTEPITGKLVNTDDPHIANGQFMFNKYCQKCHPSGEAGLGPEVTHKPGFARRVQVRHGLGVMPAFDAGLISKRDLKDIQKYLNALKKL